MPGFLIFNLIYGAFMKNLVFFMFSIFVTLSFVDKAETQTKFKVGTEFPGIKLPGIEGNKPMSIKDFRGRKVVLHIFASW